MQRTRSGQALLFSLALSSSAFLDGCARVVEDPAPDAAAVEEAGPFPENYEQIVQAWAARDLRRFGSIDRVQVTRPALGLWDKGLVRGSQHGWIAKATVRGRDRSGLTTNWIDYQVLIRGGEVVESKYLP